MVAVVISLLLPKWYAAESTILPPVEGGDSFDLMSSLIENKTLNRLGLFSATTPSDIYVEILESRTVREALVRHFDLIRLYGSMELAPLVGLADAIVDLVSTGKTLKANGLVAVEEIMPVSARLIVNQAALKTKRALLQPLIDAFAKASAP